MTKLNDRKTTALLFLGLSLMFFLMGMFFPIMRTSYGIGPLRLRHDAIYLTTSFRYFFDKGEVFVGFLLLFFTIIFPALKYVFLFLTLLGHKIPRQQFAGTALEIINKWSMLDVFVVALIILNMKFDSDIIASSLDSGTTLFALSIVLLMICSYLTKKLIVKPKDS